MVENIMGLSGLCLVSYVPDDFNTEVVDNKNKTIQRFGT